MITVEQNSIKLQSAREIDAALGQAQANQQIEEHLGDFVKGFALKFHEGSYNNPVGFGQLFMAEIILHLVPQEEVFRDFKEETVSILMQILLGNEPEMQSFILGVEVYVKKWIRGK